MLNTDYLYEHLPARFRREDAGLFLKRFLQFFGLELDSFDLIYDTFFEKINPDTAPESFIDWWLWALFGWGWFPSWFSLAQKRQFYKGIAKHYARRGTARGIEEFLAAFGVRARVVTTTPPVGELALGEDEWLMTEPLGIVVQLFPQAAAVAEDLDAVGEFALGESHTATLSRAVMRVDVDQLLRFQWPLAQTIVIEDRAAT